MRDSLSNGRGGRVVESMVRHVAQRIREWVLQNAIKFFRRGGESAWGGVGTSV